jgi:hypothetical protein
MLEQLKAVDLGILIAAAVMALGAFCPIASLPIVGSLNYVMRGNGDGRVILGCSAAITALTICGYRRTTAIPAADALMMMVDAVTRFAILLAPQRHSDHERLGEPEKGRRRCTKDSFPMMLIPRYAPMGMTREAGYSFHRDANKVRSVT